MLRRTGAGDGEAKTLIDGHDIGKIETRFDFVGLVAGRSGRLVQLFLGVAEHEKRTPVEQRLGAFKCAARHHVDAAGERRAGGLRGGRVKDFDPRDVVDRNLFELDATARAAGGRAGHAEPADRDRHVVRRSAADGNRARHSAAGVHRQAGNKFQKLAHVALGDMAELVRRDDVDHIAREPLLVDRDGGAVHFLGGTHDKLGELHRAAILAGGGRFSRVAEIEVALHDRAAGDDDRFGEHLEASEKSADLGHADRDVEKTILAGRVREDHERCTLDCDTRVFQKLTIAGVEDATLDGAVGGGLGRGGRRQGEARDQQDDADEQAEWGRVGASGRGIHKTE